MGITTWWSEPGGRSGSGDGNGAGPEGTEGSPQPRSGEPYDHRFLNYEVPPFDRVIPTTENIARDIWRRLEPHLNQGGRKLHSVRVYETADLYVDYFGDETCSA